MGVQPVIVSLTRTILVVSLLHQWHHMGGQGMIIVQHSLGPRPHQVLLRHSTIRTTVAPHLRQPIPGSWSAVLLRPRSSRIARRQFRIVPIALRCGCSSLLHCS